jgi:hypothetical protein
MKDEMSRAYYTDMEERNARGIWVKQKKELSGRFERR